MVRKGYNWKSRQVKETVVDNTATKRIQLDLNVSGNYDASNELVLPSIKRKTKVKTDKTQTQRILSRKHRKRLEKIVEKKLKKQNRAGLLEALSKVQATTDELNQLTSIASVQTKGLKRHYYEETYPEKCEKRPKRDEQLISGEIKLNALSGAKRRQLTTVNRPSNPTNVEIIDPNIVGFDNSSDSDSNRSDSPPPPKMEAVNVNQVEAITARPPILEAEPKIALKATDRQPAVHVRVNRTEDIQIARFKLPILAEEQTIMETINENSIIILAGETGSGKTTQIPQFLYEAGYAISRQIAVTEPRRVAAISMSQRVATEMNLTEKEVSYLIRFEGNATADTKIKFMTDGVLLKEIQTNFLLPQYSVVILDEAHERSVFTDILIGLLSRIVPLRAKRGDPLKLIIMSATLRLEDFTSNRKLFKKIPPVIKIESRQFPVTIHFNKVTHDDYLRDAFNKVCKIHQKLPDGGILVFLTGQQEVNSLIRKLQRRFQAKLPVRTGKRALQVPNINLDDYGMPLDQEECDFTDETSESGDDDVQPIKNGQPLHVLPLYSLLPTCEQNLVFEPAPAGARLCIVATNVAETSLTIPNIKYVVDTGRYKAKLYDKLTGVTSYMVTWVSKASAEQRTGRAGRTAPGHCYRLYSSALYNDVFAKFTQPEIETKPVDELYLQMKCMNIDKVVNFPFPSAPDLVQLGAGERRLEVLGALDPITKKVTQLGGAIVKFPVLPQFGKMLALSHQHGLLPYVVTLVAALSVQEVLLERPVGAGEEENAVRKRWRAVRRKWAGGGHGLLLGDAMVVLRAVGGAEYANYEGKKSLEAFCTENGLRHKAVLEIRKLRLQLTKEISVNLSVDGDLVVDPKMAPPSDVQAKLLRQILLAGLGDHLAKKINEDDEDYDRKLHRFAYRANNMADLVYLHDGSVLKCMKQLPEYVIYQEIYETNKVYMRGVTGVEPEWLPIYVPNVCRLSEPLGEPEPHYDNDRIYCCVKANVGEQNWVLPIVEVEMGRSLTYYKWFARFLLDGIVVKGLARWRGVLLSEPMIMVKSWARLQSRTEVLLRGLVGRGVGSRMELEEVWRGGRKNGGEFLLEEYLKWVPERVHAEVRLAWPPLD